MVTKLIVVEGPDKGLEFTLDQGNEWILGRNPQVCHFVVTDPKISGLHFKVFLKKEKYFVENLSQTNGTKIGGQFLKRAQRINDLEMIHAGDSWFRFTQVKLKDKRIKDSDYDNFFEDTSEYEDELSSSLSTPTKIVPQEPAKPEEQKQEPKQQPAPPQEPPKQEPAPSAEAPKPEGSDQKDQGQPAPEQPPQPEEQKPEPKQQQPASPQEPPKQEPAPSAEAPKPEGSDQKDQGQPAPEQPPKPEEQKQEPTQQQPAPPQEPPKQEPAPSAEAPKPEGSDQKDQKQEPPKSPSKNQDQFETIFEDLGDEETFNDFSEDYLGSERFLLKVLAGPNTGAEFALQMGRSYVIGTDVAGADIVFNDLSVSRHHARLTLSDEAEIYIEDLESRNGTIVEGEPLTSQRQITTQDLVTLGTTTFVVVDREHGEQTLVPPAQQGPEPERKKEENEPVSTSKSKVALKIRESTFILTGILFAIILVVGVGAVTLFKSSPVERPKIDYTKEIQGVLGNQFPDVKFTYNASHNSLFIVGHVLSTVDKEELLYGLNNLPFISDIDDNVVVDNAVSQEMNLVLSRYPLWRSISIHAPQPGRFVLSGYLNTREQAAELDDFVNVQFPYIDRLTNYVVVEEDLNQDIMSKLHNNGFYSVEIDLSNGEVSLSGYINSSYEQAFEKTLREISRIVGVRNVNNYVVVVGPCKETLSQNPPVVPYCSKGSLGSIGQVGEPTKSAKAVEEEFSSWMQDTCVINITDYPKDTMDISHMYTVTGYADQGPIGRAVVIKGRILTVGDMLNGMRVLAIYENFVFLEKNGLKYKIEFNR